MQTRAGGYYGAVDLAWDAFRRFGLGMSASGHHDSQTALDQGRRRPGASLPRLFGDLGGLAAGASAGEGWLRTRTAFVQIMARTSRLRIFGRVGAGTTQFAEPLLTPLTVELGGNLQIEGAITPWLRIVARSLVRTPIVVQGHAPGELPLRSRVANRISSAPTRRYRISTASRLSPRIAAISSISASVVVSGGNRYIVSPSGRSSAPRRTASR